MILAIEGLLLFSSYLAVGLIGFLYWPELKGVCTIDSYWGLQISIFGCAIPAVLTLAANRTRVVRAILFGFAALTLAIALYSARQLPTVCDYESCIECKGFEYPLFLWSFVSWLILVTVGVAGLTHRSDKARERT